MKKIFIALVLMMVAAATFADVVRKHYKSEDLGDVFIEFDNTNKGINYDELNVLAYQALLAQIYSEHYNIDVSKISYRKPTKTNDNIQNIIYKTTKEYGWSVTTIDNVKFCYCNVDDNTVAYFSIVLFKR